MKFLIIGFFILQIGLDLAHSVTAFPFVHYGMFSACFPRPDSILVYRVSLNGQVLRPQDFSIYGWDMIQAPLAGAASRDATKDYAFDKRKMQEGLSAVGLSSLYNQLRPNLDNQIDFISWYRSYLGRLLGEPVTNLQVDRTWWRWRDGKLVLTGTQNWINE